MLEDVLADHEVERLRRKRKSSYVRDYDWPVPDHAVGPLGVVGQIPITQDVRPWMWPVSAADVENKIVPSKSKEQALTERTQASRRQESEIQN
jgi:hypothetical protein